MPLIHRRLHSTDGFAWGDTSDGASDLAHSIFTIEAGDEVAASVYLRFRDDVIASLPNTRGSACRRERSGAGRRPTAS